MSIPLFRSLAAGLAVGFLGIGSALAQETASYEGFEYAAGSFATGASGGTGWFKMDKKGQRDQKAQKAQKTKEGQEGQEGWEVAAPGATIRESGLDYAAWPGISLNVAPGGLCLEAKESPEGESTAMTLARQMAVPLRLSAPGEVYFSFLYRFTGPVGRVHFLLAQNKGGGGASVMRLEGGRGQTGRFNLSLRTESKWSATAMPGVTLAPPRPILKPKEGVIPVESGFVVGRLTVRPDTKLEARYWVFLPNEKVPASPEELAPSGAVEGGTPVHDIGWMVIQLSKAPRDSIVELDELRLGGSWGAVTGK